SRLSSVLVSTSLRGLVRQIAPSRSSPCRTGTTRAAGSRTGRPAPPAAPFSATAADGAEPSGPTAPGRSSAPTRTHPSTPAARAPRRPPPPPPPPPAAPAAPPPKRAPPPARPPPRAGPPRHAGGEVGQDLVRRGPFAVDQPVGQPPGPLPQRLEHQRDDDRGG